MGLAPLLLEHFQGEPVYLIKYAMVSGLSLLPLLVHSCRNRHVCGVQGSTSLNLHWNPLAPGDPIGMDGTYFKHFISFCFKRIAALQHLEPRLECMFWMQGESDAGHT